MSLNVSNHEFTLKVLLVGEDDVTIDLYEIIPHGGTEWTGTGRGTTFAEALADLSKGVNWP